MEMHHPQNRQDYDSLLVLLQVQNGSDDEIGISLCDLSHSDQQDATRSLFQILTNRPVEMYWPLACLELNICDMCSEDDLVRDTGSFTLLLQYLRKARLPTLCLTARDAARIVRRNLLEEVATAIATNPFIDFFDCTVSSSDLALLEGVVGNATSIKKVEILFVDDGAYTTQHELMLASAFAGNRSIQVLTLVSHDNGELIAVILPEIAANPSLRHLEIDTDARLLSTAHFHALEQFIDSVQAAAAQGAPTIEKIIFRDYWFRTRAAGRIFDAIAALLTISLEFISCRMDAPATDRFVHFVHNVDRNHRVSLGITDYLDAHDRTAGSVLSEALPGSRLADLKLETGHELENDGLFHALEANYRAVWLSSLELMPLSAEELHDFAGFLAKTTRLRSLHIRILADDVDHRQLANAIRQNGSLSTINMPELHGSVYETHLEAIKERNEKVPAMLGVAAETEDDGTVVSHLPQFPPLFCAAQEAPHMAPNNVLIGLLAADEASGMVPMGR